MNKQGEFDVGLMFIGIMIGVVGCLVGYSLIEDMKVEKKMASFCEDRNLEYRALEGYGRGYCYQIIRDTVIQYEIVIIDGDIKFVEGGRE